MASQSLAPRALYQEVAEGLRQRIYNRELTPGSWIDELKIAQEYGISRTPLREALKVLAAEGLVTMKIRRGAYVTDVSDKDLRDVYHLLALLESDAAAIVAEKRSTAQFSELALLHSQLVDAAQNPADTSLFFKINEAFHVKLLEIADNRWRDQLVADLRKVMKLNRQNSLLKAGRVSQSLQEHATLLAALEHRDPVAARQAMTQHLLQGLEAAQ